MNKLAKKPEAADAGTAFPKIKPAKLPKNLGGCVDLYHATRQRRLEVERYAAQIKEEETRIFNHVLDNIPKGDGGAVGKEFKAIRTETTRYSIENDADFYAFVKRTGSFDLLNRAINQKAVAERLEDPKFIKKYGAAVPGTKGFKVFSLSVTKVR